MGQFASRREPGDATPQNQGRSLEVRQQRRMKFQHPQAAHCPRQQGGGFPGQGRHIIRMNRGNVIF